MTKGQDSAATGATAMRMLEQIDALLVLDAKGALVPPVPGHALTLLNTAADAIRKYRAMVEWMENMDPQLVDDAQKFVWSIGHD